MRVVGVTLRIGYRELFERWAIRAEDVDPLEAVTYSRWDREIPIPNAAVRRLELAGYLEVGWSVDWHTWVACSATPRAHQFLSELRAVRALPSGLLNPHACT